MRICFTPWLLAVASLTAACGGGDTSSPVDEGPEPRSVRQSLTLTTADHVQIATIIEKPNVRQQPAPAVILIHGNDAVGKAEWVGLDVYQRLLEEGYIVVAFDIRTYGQSGTDGGTQGGLLEDPNRAPLDLQRVVEFLRTDSDVDASRIGAIGSKLGAEMASVGVGTPSIGLKTMVGLSTVRAGVFQLSRNSVDFQLHTVFYIVGGDEGFGALANDAQALFEQTTEPRKLTIVSGSGATGTALLAVDPSLENEIITWIQETL